MQTATLRLFHAIQVDQKHRKTVPAAILERGVKHGYLLDPALDPTPELLTAIETVVGLSGEQANAAFHKSWATIQNSRIETLVMQQIVHYITTYGFEYFGIYHQDMVYIPREKLEVPALGDDIPLIVIHALDAAELFERILRLGSGVALAQQTLDDVMEIVRANAYDSAFIPQIKNRELQARLYDFYGLVPTEPVEFLRYLVYRLTSETLLVKNDALIEKLKLADFNLLDALLEKAPTDLASIFLRFKPLFLALKTASHHKNFFNRLRKQAKKLHQPLPEDYFNSITVQIKRRTLNLTVLEQKLTHISIFRKIRLANALQYRLRAIHSIVYRVRTGRGWASEFDWPEGLATDTKKSLDMVIASIVRDIQPNVAGKIIYIPAQVHYAVPATEKQFTGHFPTGTSISTTGHMVVGLHWLNTARRIDFDLSLLAETTKFGWDAHYRSGDASILFSGDMTDAPPPHGASELFYIKSIGNDRFLLMANYFNFDSSDPVEAQIVLAQDTPTNFEHNYMLDPNKILARASLKLANKQNVLGLIAKTQGDIRFYFANIILGNSISAKVDGHTAHARKYLVNSMLNALDLAQILRAAGANVVSEIPSGKYLDLSPEMLEKTTILNLITPQTADTKP